MSIVVLDLVNTSKIYNESAFDWVRDSSNIQDAINETAIFLGLSKSVIAGTMIEEYDSNLDRYPLDPIFDLVALLSMDAQYVADAFTASQSYFGSGPSDLQEYWEMSYTRLSSYMNPNDPSVKGVDGFFHDYSAIAVAGDESAIVAFFENSFNRVINKSGTNKIFEPLLMDVGNANIKVATAILH